MSNKQTILFKPHIGPQTDFLSNPAYECLFASSVGQGKSLCLLIEAARYVHNKNYKAILFRRTMKELEATLIKDSKELYDKRISGLGGTYNETKKTWTFPSGATIAFGYIDHERDLTHYQGWQGQYCAFDELTHFTEDMYIYMFSRLRTTDDTIPIRMRAATNPGGIGHEWVYNRWNYWLNPNHDSKLDSNSIIKYKRKVKVNGETIETTLTRSCIMSYMGDNISIDNDEYIARLGDMTRTKREQLLNNDWTIKPSLRELFDTDKILVVEYNRLGQYA